MMYQSLVKDCQKNPESTKLYLLANIQSNLNIQQMNRNFPSQVADSNILVGGNQDLLQQFQVPQQTISKFSRRSTDFNFKTKTEEIEFLKLKVDELEQQVKQVFFGVQLEIDQVDNQDKYSPQISDNTHITIDEYINALRNQFDSLLTDTKTRLKETEYNIRDNHSEMFKFSENNHSSYLEQPVDKSEQYDRRSNEEGTALFPQTQLGRRTYSDHGNLQNLSATKMVKLGIWEEKQLFLLHVAEYEKTYRGEHYRPKNGKGLTLTYEQWRKFYQNVDFINQDVQQLAAQLN
ncbi:UNKNOWN [Stylonychia lemnae]|uniref:Uncharacterized protein n=1 Tax=Stylonychia lemnae TaxID=5949 RepID=A0A078AFN1_STYLE|nr:UNKNOWN [Stylonychia lemnae]|eukprot:CDW80312.1 UNKNOWN [Stylonychia lemnae]